MHFYFILYLRDRTSYLNLSDHQYRFWLGLAWLTLRLKLNLIWPVALFRFALLCRAARKAALRFIAQVTHSLTLSLTHFHFLPLLRFIFAQLPRLATHLNPSWLLTIWLLYILFLYHTSTLHLLPTSATSLIVGLFIYFIPLAFPCASL